METLPPASYFLILTLSIVVFTALFGLILTKLSKLANKEHEGDK